MTAWFFVSVYTKRNDVADIAWGIGFVFVVIASAMYNSSTLHIFEISSRVTIVLILVAVWGTRLSFHIYKRNKNKPEDKRYANWRSTWKYFYTRSFFQVFMLQGFLLLLIIVPVLIINSYSFYQSGITMLDVLGIIIWIKGFVFESVGDAQLKKFIKDPSNKGKIMNQGLWKFTRHPNYYGEVMQWWGIFVIALSVPYGYFGIIGPLTISFLILKVSGIPMLEKGFAGRPDFEEYKRKTSAFIPWFPKK